MYDLIIIGAGWAGFNAALPAKASGLRVCLIDKGPLGGVCLNKGCIPTKALLESAKILSFTRKAAAFGIDLACEPAVNIARITLRKDTIVQQLRSGMQGMLKGIEYICCEAKIICAGSVKAGSRTLDTKNILVATGSKAVELQGLAFDGSSVVSSDEAIALARIPRSLLIVGGGVIGCEFASLFSRLGSNVSIIELSAQLLPGEDKEVARKLEASFKKRGINVSLNTDALAVARDDHDFILVCVGRIPYTQGLGLEELGVRMERGKIAVDESLRTNIPGIYAAGDCTGEIMLAHLAAHQGRVAAENIAHPEDPRKVSYEFVPNCIFTDPEIASLGSRQTGAADTDLLVHRFDFRGLGMARIKDEAEGFIKILSDKNTGIITGASIIGPAATELIGILSVALESRLTVSGLRKVIFAHPTLSESIGEALR